MQLFWDVEEKGKLGSIANVRKQRFQLEGSLTYASLEVKNTYTAFLPAEYSAATVENAMRWIK